MKAAIGGDDALFLVTDQQTLIDAVERRLQQQGLATDLFFLALQLGDVGENLDHAAIAGQRLIDEERAAISMGALDGARGRVVAGQTVANEILARGTLIAARVSMLYALAQDRLI